MKLLENLFVNLLDELWDDDAKDPSNEDIVAALEAYTPRAAMILDNKIKQSFRDTVDARQSLSAQFQDEHYNKWHDGLQQMEILTLLCGEITDYLARSRAHPPQPVDAVYASASMLLRRACYLTREILYLMKGGFADGAHGPWRHLHETNVIARFLVKHGEDTAERFLQHHRVTEYLEITRLDPLRDIMAQSKPGARELDDLKARYDAVLQKYGHRYGQWYGWAGNVFPGVQTVELSALEADVGLDKMQAYYHSSGHPHLVSLTGGFPIHPSREAVQAIFDTQRDLSMSQPALAASLSLAQITSELLSLHGGVESLVLRKVVSNYSEDIAHIFPAIAAEHRHRAH